MKTRKFTIRKAFLLLLLITAFVVPVADAQGRRRVIIKKGRHQPAPTPDTDTVSYPDHLIFGDYYASPTGSPGNAGNDYDSPWDLQTALNHTDVITAGKVLALKNGTYHGKFKCNLTGVKITGGVIRPKIDGYVYTTLTNPMAVGVAGAYATFAVGNAATLKPFYDSGAMDTLIIDGEAFHLEAPNGDPVFSGNNITAKRAGAGSEPAATAPAHIAGSLVRAAGNQLWIAGNNVTVQGLEFMSSEPRRDWRYDGAEGLRGCGVFAPAVSGTKIVNNYIHDNLSGIFTGSSSSNTEIYGNLIQNNGMYDGTTEGKGHGLYLENPTGYSRIYNNIIVNNFGIGTQMYGRSAVYSGGDAQGNLWANAGAPLGAGIRHHNLRVGPEEQRIVDVLIQDNVLFHPHSANAYNMQLGYGFGCDNGHVLNNYFIGGGALGLEITNTTRVTATGNKFDSTNSNGINIQTSQQGPLYTIDNNTYYDCAANAGEFGNTTAHANQTFAQWKTATGYDVNSIFFTTPLPATVIVKPNAYTTGRANIYVITPTGTTSAAVDLALAGIPVGHNYRVVNAFNMDSPQASVSVVYGTYNGGSQVITIPLNTAEVIAVASPVGGGYTPATTSPNCVAFILISN